MAKNYYDPRNIRRMTRNVNMRNQDFLRWQKQQEDRRAEEQERLRAAEQAAADLANGSVLNEFSIAISAQVNRLFTTIQPGTPVYIDTDGRLEIARYGLTADSITFDEFKNPPAPKPPRIEPSPFSMIEVDDES